MRPREAIISQRKLALVFTVHSGPEARTTSCRQKGDFVALSAHEPSLLVHCSQSTCTKYFYAKAMKIQRGRSPSKFLISYLQWLGQQVAAQMAVG